MPAGLALCLTLINSNYPCLEDIFMVPNVFEPLKFGCSFLFPLLVELCTSFYFTSFGFEFGLHAGQKSCHKISADVCAVYPAILVIISAVFEENVEVLS